MMLLLLHLILPAALVARSFGATQIRHSSQGESDSYGDLALINVPAKFQRAVELLPLINATSRPQDVKLLRVALLEAAQLLDIFVFAYPNDTTYSSDAAPERSENEDAATVVQKQHEAKTLTNGKGSNDVWFTARLNLNDGYEVLGDFQDLAHRCGLHELAWACKGWQRIRKQESMHL